MIFVFVERHLQQKAHRRKRGLEKNPPAILEHAEAFVAEDGMSFGPIMRSH